MLSKKACLAHFGIMLQLLKVQCLDVRLGIFNGYSFVKSRCNHEQNSRGF